MKPLLPLLLVLGLACASGPLGPDGQPDPGSAIKTTASDRPGSVNCGAKCQMRRGRNCPCAGVAGHTGRPNPSAPKPASPESQESPEDE